MNKKKMTGVIYLNGSSAVKNFSDHSLIFADAPALASRMADADIDSILCFNVSDADDELNAQALAAMKEICKVSTIPVYGGGHIHSVPDVEAIFEAGCEKVILNFAKESAQEILAQIKGGYEPSQIAATIASEDNLVINRELLESSVGELILIDEHALKNCLGASTIPCIVFLPEISLDKMFAIMAKPNVSGISGNIVNENISSIATLKKLCREQGIAVVLFEPAIPFSELKKGENGLVPCIVQDEKTGEVLMMAWMNEEAYLRTLRTGKMTYYSRSRKQLWIKGETSGHFQYVKQFCIDCDNDTLLAVVDQVGAACHTGNHSCFYRDILPAGKPHPYQQKESGMTGQQMKRLEALEVVIEKISENLNSLEESDKSQEENNASRTEENRV